MSRLSCARVPFVTLALVATALAVPVHAQSAPSTPTSEPQAASEHAGGFTMGDLVRAGAAVRADPQAQLTSQLLGETDALRMALLTAQPAALDSRTEAEKAALNATFGQLDTPHMARLAWFMGGAVIRPAFEAGVPETYLYHPLTGKWLRLGWVDDGQRWRLGSISSLVDPAASDWTGVAGKPYLDALAASYAAAIQAPPTGPLASTALFDSIDRWMAGGRRWLTHKPRRDAAGEVRKAIAEGRSARLVAKGDGVSIDVLPFTLRQSFTAMTAFDRADGQTVLFASPAFPQVLIAADFSPGDAPALKALTLLNLAHATGDKK